MPNSGIQSEDKKLPKIDNTERQKKKTNRLWVMEIMKGMYFKEERRHMLNMAKKSTKIKAECLLDPFTSRLPMITVCNAGRNPV